MAKQDENEIDLDTLSQVAGGAGGAATGLKKTSEEWSTLDPTPFAPTHVVDDPVTVHTSGTTGHLGAGHDSPVIIGVPPGGSTHNGVPPMSPEPMHSGFGSDPHSGSTPASGTTVSVGGLHGMDPTPVAHSGGTVSEPHSGGMHLSHGPVSEDPMPILHSGGTVSEPHSGGMHLSHGPVGTDPMPIAHSGGTVAEPHSGGVHISRVDPPIGVVVEPHNSGVGPAEPHSAMHLSGGPGVSEHNPIVHSAGSILSGMEHDPASPKTVLGHVEHTASTVASAVTSAVETAKNAVESVFQKL